MITSKEYSRVKNNISKKKLLKCVVTFVHLFKTLQSVIWFSCTHLKTLKKNFPVLLGNFKIIFGFYPLADKLKFFN